MSISLSMLQDAQSTARSIATIQALANMKQEQDDLSKSSPLSPSSMIGSVLSADATNLYAGLFAGAQMGMLSPQMLAANQTAAALITARLASSASNFYQHPLFPWHLPPINNASPPISPISPALSVKSMKKLTNNNNIVSTTTNDGMSNNNFELNLNNNLKNATQLSASPTTASRAANGKKVINRKTVNFKKKRNQIMFQPYTSPETTPLERETSPGPISPPTSGSSPQSIASVEHQSPSSSNLIGATPNKEPSRDKSFTCQTCNRSFGYKHVLQNHERTHTGEKPFACPECDKRFTRDHHLKTHMRLHTGEKPYHCKFCERQFVQVANLRRHLRVHTGEKPYACDKCDSKFSDSNQLKAHSLIHKNEKPFRCESCGASFRRSHHLVNHKCANAPLTPATSPVISVDNKSITPRSDASEQSLNLTAQNATIFKHLQLTQNMAAAAQHRSQALQQIYESALPNVLCIPHEMPLDLSIEGNSLEYGEKRNRKSHDVRHILRMPKPEILIQQSEPEDLSMHSSRSPSSLISEEDLDDLDDAESLNRRNQIATIATINH